MIIKRKLVIIIMHKSQTKNKSYNHVILNLQDYMMSNILYLKFDTKKIESTENKKSSNLLKKKDTNSELITLKEEDQLFWYFYIAKYGYDQYKILDHKFTHEKNIKISNIEKVKQNKDLLKQNKLKISEFEVDLLNSKKISLKTLQGLSIYNNLNIYYIENKIFNFFNYNDNNESIIIYKDNKNYSCNINPSSEIVNNIKNNYYYVENINKPINAISNYKLAELVDIAKKLGIKEKLDTGKVKNKNMLYEEIKVKF